MNKVKKKLSRKNVHSEKQKIIFADTLAIQTLRTKKKSKPVLTDDMENRFILNRRRRKNRIKVHFNHINTKIGFRAIRMTIKPNLHKMRQQQNEKSKKKLNKIQITNRNNNKRK